MILLNILDTLSVDGEQSWTTCDGTITGRSFGWTASAAIELEGSPTVRDCDADIVKNPMFDSVFNDKNFASNTIPEVVVLSWNVDQAPGFPQW